MLVSNSQASYPLALLKDPKRLRTGVFPKGRPKYAMRLELVPTIKRPIHLLYHKIPQKKKLGYPPKGKLKLVIGKKSTSHPISEAYGTGSSILTLVRLQFERLTFIPKIA